jgi:hypothetical protein
MSAGPDLTPFWCLMAYDTKGRRTYAYGDGAPFDASAHYTSPHGALSHRPQIARKFATAEEAAAALPGLLPWIQRYLAEDRRLITKDRTPLELAAPLAPYFERDLLCVYPDGSGLARQFVAEGMAYLQRQEEACRVARAFVQKHLATLAGMSWRISIRYEGPECQVGGAHRNAYRGEYCDAARIAKLWPVKWTRRKPDYQDRGWLTYDWVSELDGVRLIIDTAERHRTQPPDDGLDGTRVRLESEVAA